MRILRCKGFVYATNNLINMGCCIETKELEFQIKHGEVFHYSIFGPDKENNTWVLTNKDQLAHLMVSQLGPPRVSNVDTEHKVKVIEFNMHATQRGQETLLFVQYATGTTKIKRIQRVKVKVL